MKLTPRHPGAPLAALALCTLLMSACSDSRPTQATETGGPAPLARQPNPEFIQVAPAGTDTAPDSGPIPGRVAFRPEAVLAVDTPVGGRIVSLAVRPGDRVKAGATLLTLQSPAAADARTTLQQATARAEAAADLLRRQEEMMARGIGLEVERFEAAMRLREARAELARARQAAAMIGAGQGDRITLRAPQAGVVAAVRASAGAVVEPHGEPLVELADPARLWVVADVAEGELAAIDEGRQAVVRLPGVDKRLAGVVTGIGARIDPETRRAPIYVSLSATVPGLAPGMLAEVALTSQDSNAVLSLPATAVLIKDGTQRIVYVQSEDGRFEPRPVRTGQSRGGQVVVLEGLQPGEPVVVRGALLLDGEAEQLL